MLESLKGGVIDVSVKMMNRQFMKVKDELDKLKEENYKLKEAERKGIDP